MKICAYPYQYPNIFAYSIPKYLHICSIRDFHAYIAHEFVVRSLELFRAGDRLGVLTRPSVGPVLNGKKLRWASANVGARATMVE
jgi:hypothetical protein